MTLRLGPADQAQSTGSAASLSMCLDLISVMCCSIGISCPNNPDLIVLMANLCKSGYSNMTLVDASQYVETDVFDRYGNSLMASVV